MYVVFERVSLFIIHLLRGLSRVTYTQPITLLLYPTLVTIPFESYENFSRAPRSNTGTTIETKSDGTRIQTFEDGATLTTQPDGLKVQKFTDGMVITIYKDNRKVQKNKDGVVVETLPSGDKITKHPDGDVIEHYMKPREDIMKGRKIVMKETKPDGTIVVTDDTGEMDVLIDEEGNESS